MKKKSGEERCLSSHLLATVLLKHLAARPSSQYILLSVCIILFRLKCPGVTYCGFNFYSCLVNLIFFKDSSSDLALLLPGLLSPPVPSGRGFCACPILLSCWCSAPCQTSKMQYQVPPYAAFPQLAFQI